MRSKTKTNTRSKTKNTAFSVFLQGYAARGDSIVIVRCVQSWLSAPRDADTADGGMRTLRVQIPSGHKNKKHRKSGVELSAEPIQEYAARGNSVLTVKVYTKPALCSSRRRYRRWRYANPPGSFPWGTKRKNTIHDGVFSFWCTFRDSNPGPTD